MVYFSLLPLKNFTTKQSPVPRQYMRMLADVIFAPVVVLTTFAI
jgi:hypothetical protein